MLRNDALKFKCVSVIIPARNEASNIGNVVHSILCQASDGIEREVIVVDDGSTDGTAQIARSAGAHVLALEQGSQGNPSVARNRGAAIAKGDPLIFLDADCVVGDGWLEAILAAHEKGATIVGGSLDLPPGLSAMARCDYYCGWYVVHSRRPAGYVPHHPPPNLSVRREAFYSTAGFSEHPPLNEERIWQSQLQRAGHRIYFEPKAIAYHYNRPGFRNLLRRSFRWGYTAIESKHQTRATRMAWLYRYPRLVIATSLPLAFAHTIYILGCWIRIGIFEPLLMLPAVLASRFAYVAGMAVGGIQWLRYRDTTIAAEQRPRPRWW